MPELVRAGESVVEQIISASYPIWNEGLTLDGYRRWNDLQTRTTWGKEHIWRVALVAGGEYLASAKWYDLRCELNGEAVRVLGIGAVFTPEGQRGRGRAKELPARMLQQADAEGHKAALLLSEIRPPYQDGTGSTAIPAQTPPTEPAGAGTVRSAGTA